MRDATNTRAGRGTGKIGTRPPRWAYWIIALAIGPVHAGGDAAALNIRPFRTFNQSPLIQIYGLPTPEDSLLLDRGKIGIELNFDLSSNFSSRSNQNETLVLDGETYRTSLRYRRGMGGGWEIGIDVPHVSHDGGFLDDFIIDWHDTFGFSQGGRDNAPTDRLAYIYVRDGATLVNIDKDHSGVGDVRFIASYQWRGVGERQDSPIALHASLKLPTGESDDLLGSGGTDFAAWVSGARTPSRSGPNKWAWFASGGLLFVGDGDVLPRQQRNLVTFGTLGIGWRPGAWFLFQLQLDAHTSFYDDSRLKQIDATAAQLTMGGALRLGERTRLDIGVSEDVAVDTAPDVNFHFNLRSYF